MNKMDGIDGEMMQKNKYKVRDENGWNSGKETMDGNDFNKEKCVSPKWSQRRHSMTAWEGAGCRLAGEKQGANKAYRAERYSRWKGTRNRKGVVGRMEELSCSGESRGNLYPPPGFSNDKCNLTEYSIQGRIWTHTCVREAKNPKLSYNCDDSTLC